MSGSGWWGCFGIPTKQATSRNRNCGKLVRSVQSKTTDYRCLTIALTTNAFESVCKGRERRTFGADLKSSLTDATSDSNEKRSRRFGNYSRRGLQTFVGRGRAFQGRRRRHKRRGCRSFSRERVANKQLQPEVANETEHPNMTHVLLRLT